MLGVATAVTCDAKLDARASRKNGVEKSRVKDVAVLQNLGRHQQNISHVVVRIEKIIAMRWRLGVTSQDTCLET